MKNRELSIRVEESSFLHIEGALLTKNFAELEENLKMIMAKENYIYIVIEKSFSLNVSLWIILTVPVDVFNKTDTL